MAHLETQEVPLSQLGDGTTFESAEGVRFVCVDAVGQTNRRVRRKDRTPPTVTLWNKNVLVRTYVERKLGTLKVGDKFVYRAVALTRENFEGHVFTVLRKAVPGVGVIYRTEEGVGRASPTHRPVVLLLDAEPDQETAPSPGADSPERMTVQVRYLEVGAKFWWIGQLYRVSTRAAVEGGGVTVRRRLRRKVWAPGKELPGSTYVETRARNVSAEDAASSHRARADDDPGECFGCRKPPAQCEGAYLSCVSHEDSHDCIASFLQFASDEAKTSADVAPYPDDVAEIGAPVSGPHVDG